MSQTCPQCGAPMPTDAECAPCAACMLRQAMLSRTVVDEPSPRLAIPPPSAEEMAATFPQFEILELLGRGGMGVVYKARQKSLNRTVAIKVLAPERGGDASFAERFAREAEFLAKMSHPHIVTVHDFGEADGLYHLVMEFVDGVNLRDLLRAGKLEPEQALTIVPPICEALEYAHGRGVIHRDIKPENLLLDREGRIKIADFGIASLVGTAGESSGTPPYMAPEQSDGNADERADIYALGVVLYEMLTGERPDRDAVAPSRRVGVDVRMDEVVLRALEKEPERRYQTAGEFRTVVQTIAVSAKESKTQMASAEQPRFSKMAILGACWAVFPALLVMLLLLASFEWNRNSAPSVKWSVLLIQIGFGILVVPAISAPIGATVLGWVAAGRIRRSDGRLRGLLLAIAVGLLFPLLFVNGLVVYAVVLVVALLGLSVGKLAAMACLPFLVAVDCWTVWIVHRRWSEKPIPRSRIAVPVLVGAGAVLLISSLGLLALVWANSSGSRLAGEADPPTELDHVTERRVIGLSDDESLNPFRDGALSVQRIVAFDEDGRSRIVVGLDVDVEKTSASFAFNVYLDLGEQDAPCGTIWAVVGTDGVVHVSGEKLETTVDALEPEVTTLDLEFVPAPEVMTSFPIVEKIYGETEILNDVPLRRRDGMPPAASGGRDGQFLLGSLEGLRPAGLQTPSVEQTERNER